MLQSQSLPGAGCGEQHNSPQVVPDLLSERKDAGSLISSENSLGSWVGDRRTEIPTPNIQRSWPRGEGLRQFWPKPPTHSRLWLLHSWP